MKSIARRIVLPLAVLAASFDVVAAPDTTITSSPPSLTTSTSATFAFTSNDPSARFQCSLDNAFFTNCTSPITYSNLIEGGHLFNVRAVDTAGVVDPFPAKVIWTVDSTPPDTTITSKPPLNSTSSSATFAFTTNDPNATLYCRLDSQPLVTCTSPITYDGIPDGNHSFLVRAVDVAGNADPSPAQWFWTIDTVPPDTAITSAPPAITTSTSATFSMTVTGAANLQCSLDDSPFAACSTPVSYTGLAQGGHTFAARAVDIAGNVDPTPALHNWTVDSVSPETSIVSGPPAISASASATFTVSTEAGATLQCSLDGAAYAACASPVTYGALAQGAHSFSVRAVDGAGNVDATPATASWTVDTIAPDTLVTSAPSALTSVDNAAFTFISDEPGTRFECALDGAAFAACTSPTTYSALGEGLHTFRVRAVDAADTPDPTPAQHQWTVDFTAPETIVTSGPAAVSPFTSATFTMQASEAGASFECALDGAPWAPCSTPITFTGLADGAHSFSVRAVDAAQNADGSPSVFTWVVDTVSPDTTIESSPAALTSQADATFAFSGTESVQTFECRLDGSAFAACASPVTYTGLAEGSHTFEVRAVDAAGNVDPQPASWTWSIDTVAPDATITSGPSGAVASSSASFAFSAEAGASFECRLDSAAFTVCSSPATYTGLAEGSHTFEVRAVDAAGNVDPLPASRTWVVDTVAPDATIISAPSGAVASSSASIAFSAEAGASFECRLDNATFAACGSPVTYTGLAEGSHTFEVRAVDAAGNVDPQPASRTWMVDTMAPDAAITSGPSGAVASSSASIAFASEADASFECRLDGAAFAACSSPITYTGLAEGSHAFEVRAIDAAGNVDASPASRTWSVDTLVPDTTITSGPSGAVASSSASIAFASEAGASFECRLDGAAFAPCSSPITYSALAEGSHTFEVRASDAAGNVDASPASRTWSVDTLAPDTTITGGPAGVVSSTSAGFSYGATEAATFECRLDGAAFAACAADGTSFDGLTQGAHTFEVRATDAVGNTDPTPASHSWTVDSLPPETSIVSGPPAISASASATFTVSTETGATLQCSLDGAAYAACASPVTYGALAQGAHSFSVRAVDGAGNVDATPATASWTVDTIAPDTLVTSAPSALTSVGNAAFTFISDEPGIRFECALDGAAFAACTSPTTYSALGEGLHTFRVRAVDAADTPDPTPAQHQWTVDFTAPETLVTSGPAAVSPFTSATFTLQASEPGATFECALDGAPWTPCSTPVTFTGLADGAHSFSVRAVDAAQNADGSPSVFTWVVDTVSPDTTIESSPAALTSQADATFAFSGIEGFQTFECRLDGAAFAACASPVTYTGLAEGSHTFEVRAVDAAGNVDPQPASWNWVIDTVAPDATITSGPSGAVSSTSASFTYGAAEAATFECRLDGGAFAACAAGGTSFTGLAQGAHTFEVRATDAVGNTDATPASRTWTVDTNAPDTSIASGPSGNNNPDTATFTFASTEAGGTFECKLDTATFVRCASGITYTALPKGEHTFQVRAIDAAGNVDASPAPRTWRSK